ncbi:hypothetical protein SAMN05444487_10936 [Marininema mesophilum]|uniref:Uncharacterized protein n=1 Tax=Marininema mesophilum TaxID=1048340 RepID=A0A1H2YDN8_9BACL|nr:hypothetical protein [Marininema mesophilum]SDX03170.1 hypothetical protein SAMN05444487_10936 [Marininema mesophilum]
MRSTGYGIGDLRYGKAKPPIIEKEDEVVIRVKAAGICGADLSRYRKLDPYVEGMAYETAALIVPSAVSVHGLYLTNLRPSGSMAVLGCGNDLRLTHLRLKNLMSNLTHQVLFFLF